MMKGIFQVVSSKYKSFSGGDKEMPNGHYDDPDGEELLSTYAKKINNLEKKLARREKDLSNIKRLVKELMHRYEYGKNVCGKGLEDEIEALKKPIGW